MNIKSVIEYKGMYFCGFQIQAKELTVQGEIENRLKEYLNKRIRIKYSSRTDSGVHATGQVISFEIPDGTSIYRLRNSLNNKFDGKIVIKNITICNDEFHPRYDAKSKLYVYRIFNNYANDSVWRDIAWHIPMKLNWMEIENGIGLIKGVHDFKLFSSEKSNKKTRIRIIDAYLNKKNDIYEIYIHGEYFLTYMIRYIVGFLVLIGRGKDTIERLKRLLEAEDSRSSYCAPAKGLELKRVFF